MKPVERMAVENIYRVERDLINDCYSLYTLEHAKKSFGNLYRLIKKIREA